MTLIRTFLYLFIISFVFSCANNEKPEWIESISEVLPTRVHRIANNERLSERNIDELKAHLRQYEDIINEKINAVEETVNLHRLLAEQYNELGMYLLALKHYEAILEIEPANHIVLNNAGIAAGQTALSRPSQEEVQSYLERAQRYYERAIEIEPRYRDPYFGLVIIHLFEFNDVAAAEDLLVIALNFFPDDTRMLFLLAQIAVIENRIDDAVEIYDKIIEKTHLEEEKKSALANRETLLGSY